MTEQPSLLHVARPRECNVQHTDLNPATGHATPLQHTSLRAASLLVLERNKACNTPATPGENTMQQTPLKTPMFVAGVAADENAGNAGAGTASESHHGLTLAELQAVAEGDWPDIEHNTVKITCKAKTRKGTPCRCKALRNGRCKFHGGLSNGPKTIEGKAKSSQNLARYWELRRAAGPYHQSAATKAKILTALKGAWRRKKLDADYNALKIRLGVRW